MSQPKNITELMVRIRQLPYIDAYSLKNHGIKIRKIGEGGSRVAYKVRGLDIVIKISNQNPGARRHARAEFKKIQNILKHKKYFPLRRYVPKVYFFEPKLGITVMKYYKRMRFNRRNEEVMFMFEKLYMDLVKPRFSDYGPQNAGRDLSGRVKILDWGL